ncbi:PIG-L family deacetylase [uncultured Lamprocystis sp.]|uniref:PIG-L family deacetylase n=1 Tax=uncultured Lamprocystis sp. TaxID=543132 RepID=UPI0025CDE032|nr:PIG-L family deacetylase [uncultured Lamprocystis sp.]
MTDLLVLALLPALGYGFGRRAERRHYRSILAREEQLRDLLDVTHRRQIFVGKGPTLPMAAARTRRHRRVMRCLFIPRPSTMDRAPVTRVCRFLIVLTILAAVNPVVLAGAVGPVPPRTPNVLLITAHPDDETLFNLGRFRERGWRMSIALVTNGEHGGVVQGLRPDYDPRSDDDILIEEDPAPGVWLTTPPAGPRVREIPTNLDLATQRRGEFLGSMALHGVTTVYFLSSLARSDFEDSWDNGVVNWDRRLLAARLKIAARDARPDLVITLNSGETWAHRQHFGLAQIIEGLHAAGHFDTPGRHRPALYGLREHGWYTESQVPQAGDIAFRRGQRSPVLGQSYEEYWRTATWYYTSQSSHPVWFAARAGVNLIPGYGDQDLIRRLDSTRGAATIDLLLRRYPPNAARQARLPARPRVLDLSDRASR